MEIFDRLDCAAVNLCGFLNLAALNARRADADALGTALDNRAHRLQIDVPPALRHIVGMADAVAELRPAPAQITYLRHVNESPCEWNLQFINSEIQPQPV
jgi:hypothetical protein